jgi:NAD(P)-dependent dehydrogenase (short-subunit alcohol dehydrogenase family)
MGTFDGRVAIVTGAGNGLGEQYARFLASEGAQVVVNDLGVTSDGTGSDPAPADRVVKAISDAGGTAVADYHSVASAEGGEAIVQTALDAFGKVDVLVNNAGFLRLSSFAKVPWEDVDDMLDVHLKGAMYVTRPAYLVMREGGYGRIVFTSSAVATFGNHLASIYGAAKGGVLGLMNVLKLEAAKFDIKVNAIAPFAMTRMGADTGAQVPEGGPAPLEHVGPEQVVPAVGYLCSDACDFSGDIWSAYGGVVARIFFGRAPGYFKDPVQNGALTLDDITANVGRIRSIDGASAPYSWPDEWRMPGAKTA